MRFPENGVDGKLSRGFESRPYLRGPLGEIAGRASF
jgi:hypothetical protein